MSIRKLLNRVASLERQAKDSVPLFGMVYQVGDGPFMDVHGRPLRKEGGQFYTQEGKLYAQTYLIMSEIDDPKRDSPPDASPARCDGGILR